MGTVPAGEGRIRGITYCLEIDLSIDAQYLTMRRSNDALYFSDEIIEKLERGEMLNVADFANMFFPSKTNGKQHKCALTLFQALDKQGVLENTQLKQLVPATNDRTMLLSHVLPKLQHFNFVKTTKTENARKYELYFSNDFYDILENTIRSWVRTCHPK